MTTTLNRPLALEDHKSYMGYGIAKPGASMACFRICSWCPDAASATQTAQAMGNDVTHGICPACYAKQIAKVTGDASDIGLAP